MDINAAVLVAVRPELYDKRTRERAANKLREQAVVKRAEGRELKRRALQTRTENGIDLNSYAKAFSRAAGYEEKYEGLTAHL